MKPIVLTVCILSSCFSYGQSLGPQVINVSGGSYKQGYFAIDWSIGELPLIDQLNASDNSFIITSGFIQAFTESPQAVNTPQIFTGNEIRILPNPTHGILEVNFFLHEKGQARLTLYDALGKHLQTREVSMFGYGKFERINMTGFASSTYLLSIEFKGSDGAVSKKGIYKIVKVK